MRGFSKAIISGNLTKDPEVRATASGQQVCAFTIAVNRGPAKDGTDQVAFIDCTAWGKPAEIISQYGKKGSSLLVSGRLNQQMWTDKASGQKRSKLEVVVDDFVFQGGGPVVNDNSEAASTKSSGKKAKAENDEPEVIPDDIPADEEDQISLDEIPF